MKKVLLSLCIIAVLALAPVSTAHAADFNLQSLFAQIAAFVNSIARTAGLENGYQVAQVGSLTDTLTKVPLSPLSVSYVIPEKTWYYTCRNYNLTNSTVPSWLRYPPCISTEKASTSPINLWQRNLVDGNIGTQAYASDFRFGYDIPLSPAPQYSPIDLSGGKIVINWGPYGYNPNLTNGKPYMNDWYVWGYVPSTNKWVQIAGEQNAPCNNSQCVNDTRTIMIPNTPLVVSKIRVTSGWGYNGTAWTSTGFRRAGNWIGLREVEVYVPQSTAPVCGNGIPEVEEACDDGNRVDIDSCRNDCRAGFGCALGSVSQGHIASEIVVSNSCSLDTASTTWARYSTSTPPVVQYPSSNIMILKGALNACLRDAIAAINNHQTQCFSGAEPNYTGSLN